MFPRTSERLSFFRNSTMTRTETRNQRQETHKNPVFWMGDLTRGTIIIHPIDIALVWSYFNESSAFHVRLFLVFVLLLFVHFFSCCSFSILLARTRLANAISWCSPRSASLSRKKPHDDAIGSCATRMERAAFNGARFVRFLLAGFYAHRQSSLFSSRLFFPLSPSQCRGKLLYFSTGFLILPYRYIPLASMMSQRIPHLHSARNFSL